ncbi:MAG: type II secretion system protein GspM [Bdellovibrionota bacterium]
MNRLQEIFSQLQTRWQELEPRERYVVAGGGAVVLIILFLFGLISLSSRMDKMRTQVRETAQEIELTKSMLREIAAIDARLKGVDLPIGQRCTVNLFTALESTLRGCGADNFSIRPIQGGSSSPYYTEQAVQIEARRLLLKTLVGCLYQIDQSPSEYRAWKFRARKRFDDPNLLDVDVQVSTFCAKSEEEAAAEGEAEEPK